jgi:hypothetical protein
VVESRGFGSWRDVWSHFRDLVLAEIIRATGTTAGSPIHYYRTRTRRKSPPHLERTASHPVEFKKSALREKDDAANFHLLEKLKTPVRSWRGGLPLRTTLPIEKNIDAFPASLL